MKVEITEEASGIDNEPIFLKARSDDLLPKKWSSPAGKPSWNFLKEAIFRVERDIETVERRRQEFAETEFFLCEVRRQLYNLHSKYPMEVMDGDKK